MNNLKEIVKKSLNELISIVGSIFIVFLLFLIPTTLGVLAIKLIGSGFNLIARAAGISLMLSLICVAVFYVKLFLNRFKLK